MFECRRFRLEVLASIFGWICVVVRISFIITLAVFIYQEYGKTIDIIETATLYGCLTYTQIGIVLTFFLIVGIRKKISWLVLIYIILNTLEIVVTVSLTGGGAAYVYQTFDEYLFPLVLVGGVFATAVLIGVEVVLFILCDRFHRKKTPMESCEKLPKKSFFNAILKPFTTSKNLVVTPTD